MPFVDLLIAGLAVWQIVEIYHHSQLMAPVRARMELLDNKLSDLQRCPFCMSPWVAWLLVLPAFLLPECLVREVWFYLVCGFAVARFANLGNDLTYGYCRTPKWNR